MDKATQSKLYYRFLKWFYNIEGDFTADHEREIQKFSAEVYPFMMTVLVGGFLLSMLFNTDLTSLVYLIAVVYPLAYQASVAQKLGWGKLTIVPSQLKEAHRKMFRKTLRTTLGYTIVLFVTFFWLWQSGIPQETDTTFEVYWKIAVSVVMLLYASIIFVVTFFSNRRKIKVVKE